MQKSVRHIKIKMFIHYCYVNSECRDKFVGPESLIPRR